MDNLNGVDDIEFNPENIGAINNISAGDDDLMDLVGNLDG